MDETDSVADRLARRGRPAFAVQMALTLLSIAAVASGLISAFAAFGLIILGGMAVIAVTALRR